MSSSLQPHGISRQEYWSGLPFPSPGDLPNPGTEPTGEGGAYFMEYELSSVRATILFIIQPKILHGVKQGAVNNECDKGV